MRVRVETVYAIELTQPEAGKLERTVTRVMENLARMADGSDEQKGLYSRMVSLGDIDQLLALRTELRNVLSPERGSK